MKNPVRKKRKQADGYGNDFKKKSKSPQPFATENPSAARGNKGESKKQKLRPTPRDI